MQIVIDIPEEQIEKCLRESKYILEDKGEKGFIDITLLYTNKQLEFVDIVRRKDFYSLEDRYMVLPKGHGRLISADSLIEQHKADCEINCPYPKKQRDIMCRACDTGTAIEMLEDAPTVIAAEKSEDGKH